MWLTDHWFKLVTHCNHYYRLRQQILDRQLNVVLIPINDLQLVNNTAGAGLNRTSINQDSNCSLNENIDCNAPVYAVRCLYVRDFCSKLTNL